MPTLSRPWITSSANERLKHVRRLRRARGRRQTGQFLIEGYREVRRAVEAGVPIDDLYVCPDLYQGRNEALVAGALEARGVTVSPVGSEAFRSVTTRDRPDGLVAVARRYALDLGRQTPGPDALLLVTEGVERPGNLGTMLRTACAAGAGGVVVGDPVTDVFGPEVVRASVGTMFLLPLSVATSADAVRWLRGRGIRVVVTSPAGERDYWEHDLRLPTAVVVGSEQHGVSDRWLRAADARLRIPMAGPVDSLNVSVAAAVVLFDALRQRRAVGLPGGR